MQISQLVTANIQFLFFPVFPWQIHVSRIMNNLTKKSVPTSAKNKEITQIQTYSIKMNLFIKKLSKNMVIDFL